MPYKLHGVFTEEASRAINNRLPSVGESIRTGLLNDIVYLSRMGLLREGASEAEQIRINGAVVPETVNVVAPTPIRVGPPAYVLGPTSMTRLNNLKPELRSCVIKAILLTTQDFTVLQTLRTLDEQKKAVAAGNSRTMHSKHLPQPQDHGLAWAVDLGAWVNGTVSWDEDRYADIAFAMDQAATDLGFAHHIRWGCSWDRVLDDFGGSHKAYLDEALAYAKRFRAANPGKTPLHDAPHFEWVP